MHHNTQNTTMLIFFLFVNYHGWPQEKSLGLPRGKFTIFFLIGHTYFNLNVEIASSSVQQFDLSPILLIAQWNRWKGKKPTETEQKRKNVPQETCTKQKQKTCSKQGNLAETRLRTWICVWVCVCVCSIVLCACETQLQLNNSTNPIRNSDKWQSSRPPCIID